jgi:hypothetical protein
MHCPLTLALRRNHPEAAGPVDVEVALPVHLDTVDHPYTGHTGHIEDGRGQRQSLPLLSLLRAWD